MSDPFTDFLHEPSLESFLLVRNYVLHSPDYDAYSMDLNELDALIEAEEYDKSLERFPEVLPNLLLSPRLHLMMAYVRRQKGDSEGAEAEGAIAHLCANGILMTGEGTKDKPWLVLRTSDEYDVLMFIDKKMTRQALIGHNGRKLDRLDCEDGTQAWFDVTDAMTSLENRRK